MKNQTLAVIAVLFLHSAIQASFAKNIRNFTWHPNCVIYSVANTPKTATLMCKSHALIGSQAVLGVHKGVSQAINASNSCFLSILTLKEA
jgi:hypothetical protein